MAVSLLPPCSLTDDRCSLSQDFGSCVPLNFGVSEGSLKLRGICVRRTDLLKHRAPQSSPSSSSISDSDEHVRLARALSILRCVSASLASQSRLRLCELLFLRGSSWSSSSDEGVGLRSNLTGGFFFG